MFAVKQYCNWLKANLFKLPKGSRAQLKQTLTTIMVAMFFFQLISSKAVAKVSCSSCVFFFSSVMLIVNITNAQSSFNQSHNFIINFNSLRTWDLT